MEIFREVFSKKLNRTFEKNISLFFDKLNYNKICCLLIVLSLMIGMYILNHNTPLMVDDFGYAFGVNGERISNVEQIIESQYYHYYTWGGRSVVHFIAQFFLMYDKEVFNIVNTFAYIGMVLVIYFHIIGKMVFYPFLLLFINICLFLCMPEFGQVFLWLTGACNYLWGPLLLLSYLLVYRIQYMRANPIIKNKILSILFLPCAVIAGWTNENMGFALVGMIIAFIFVYWKKYRKIYLWMKCSLLGAVSGSLLLIMAPGNFVRMQSSDSEVKVIENFIAITGSFVDSGYLLLPAAVFCILLIVCPKNVDYTLLGIYVIGLFISEYAMIGAPVFADRAKSGSLYLAIITSGYLYTFLNFEDIKLRKILAVCAIAMLFITKADYSIARGDIKHYNERHNQNIEHVLQEKEKGNLNPVIKFNKADTKYAAQHGLEDITSDSDYWTNKSFARYYGLETVRAE